MISFIQIHFEHCFLFFQVIGWISEIKGTESVTLIGLTDLDTEGKFVWDSGRELSDDVAAFWKEGQPNNHYGLEHCTCIVNGLMMDRICEDPSPKDPEPHGFICQKRMEMGNNNYDTPTLWAQVLPEVPITSNSCFQVKKQSPQNPFQKAYSRVCKNWASTHYQA